MKVHVLPRDIQREEWNAIVSSFLDHDLMQSWEWGETKRRAGWEIVRLICEHNGQIKSAAQCRIKRVPLLGVGIVWIPRGPVFQKGQMASDLESLAYTLKSIRRYFCDKGRFMIRVAPNAESSPELNRALVLGGFQKSDLDIMYRCTYRLGLEADLDAIRAGFHSKWRNMLNRAEREGIDVHIVNSHEGVEEFVNAYLEMLDRKHLDSSFDPNSLFALHELYHETNSMGIFLARKGSSLLGGAVIPVLGSKCLYLAGATTNEGLNYSSSYLIQWEVIKWAKSLGIRSYDLGGADETTSKGVYRFKKRMGGEHVQLTGDWEFCPDPLCKRAIKLMIRMKFRQHPPCRCLCI